MASIVNEKPVVIITGCSVGGIGHELARAFANKGCSVAATARSMKAMADFEHDPRFFLQELDVISDKSVESVVSNVVEKFGRIDILVNNAGVQCVGPLAEIPLSQVQNTFNTNVFGPMRMIQAVVPHMAERRSGKVVNIGSIGALAPGPWGGTYNASKAAVHSLTDSLRFELNLLGIQVTNVVPGVIRSNIGPSAANNYKTMPDWKLYKDFKDLIQKRVEFIATTKATPADVFAQDTVAVVLKEKSPAWYSSGNYSTIMAIMYHLPIFVKDFLIGRAMHAHK
ncbi:short-chain dehydrogenase RED1-like [Rutidosis leptorrhynchoides]|uniref:short-chain dehydrogenase RED1-like n=1 Tax=Rutidosis leptorrhynchoides TaxID=125765 RepID=UPI003A9A0739